MRHITLPNFQRRRVPPFFLLPLIPSAQDLQGIDISWAPMMEGNTFTFFETLRSLQSPLATGSEESFVRPSGLGPGAQRGLKVAPPTASRSNPPLVNLPQDAENRRPLFNMLYTSQDKLRQPSLAPTHGLQEQRAALRKRGVNGEGHDHGGHPKDLSEFEFEPRSTVAPRPPPGEPSRRSDHTGPVSTVPSPPLSVSCARDEGDVFYRDTLELKAQIDKLAQTRDGVLQERALVQSELNTARAQLSESAALISELKADNSASERRYTESCEKLVELQNALSAANARVDLLTTQIAEKDDENQRIRGRSERLVQQVRDMRTRVDEQHTSFISLQGSQKTLTTSVGDIMSNLSSLRSATSEALEASKTIFGSETWLSNLRESRTVINELQGQLESSKEVITILRDKLHHLASVLAEHKVRVEELENEKKTSFAKIHQDYEEVKARYQHSVSLEKKVEHLTERLVAREVETFDYLATSVSLEERLEVAQSETTRLKSIISENEAELATLRKGKEEHFEKLLASQEVTSGKDRELATLRTEVKNLVESKGELKALLSEAKKVISEKDQELLRRNPNPELEARVQDLNVQIERCTLESTRDRAEKQSQFDALMADKKRSDETHQLNYSRLAAELQKLQAQESEQITFLKKAISQQTDSIDILVQEKKGAIAQFEIDQAQLRTSLKGSEQEKHELEKQLEKTRIELARLEEEYTRLQSEIENTRLVTEQKMKSDLSTQSKLLEAHELRAISAEKAFTISQHELETERLKIGELTQQLNLLTLSLGRAQSLLAEKDDALARVPLTVDLADLQAQIEKLTSEKDELKEHALRIVERYHQGSLSEIEKDLVHHIVQIAESTHEQNLLEREQEIRSRDNQLIALQQRIKSLEKTLARVLDEANGTGGPRPIVNLKTLMHSSPEEAMVVGQSSDLHRGGGSGEGEMAPRPAILEQAETSFKKLSQMNSDSDDDIPLSELSELSTIMSDVKKKRIRVNSPSPAPAPVPPSAQSKTKGKSATANKRGKTGTATVDKQPPVETGTARGRQLKRK